MISWRARFEENDSNRNLRIFARINWRSGSARGWTTGSQRQRCNNGAQQSHCFVLIQCLGGCTGTIHRIEIPNQSRESLPAECYWLSAQLQTIVRRSCTWQRTYGRSFVSKVSQNHRSTRLCSPAACMRAALSPSHGPFRVSAWHTRGDAPFFSFLLFSFFFSFFWGEGTERMHALSNAFKRVPGTMDGNRTLTVCVENLCASAKVGYFVFFFVRVDNGPSLNQWFVDFWRRICSVKDVRNSLVQRLIESRIYVRACSQSEPLYIFPTWESSWLLFDSG